MEEGIKTFQVAYWTTARINTFNNNNSIVLKTLHVFTYIEQYHLQNRITCY